MPAAEPPSELSQVHQQVFEQFTNALIPLGLGLRGLFLNQHPKLNGAQDAIRAGIINATLSYACHAVFQAKIPLNDLLEQIKGIWEQVTPAPPPPSPIISPPGLTLVGPR